MSDASSELTDNSGLSYLESTMGYVMKRAQMELNRSIYECLGDTELTLVQFSVLSIAQENPGIAQSELAQVLGVERPRLVPIVDRLEELKLAQRRKNPEDRRGRMIYLTTEGHSRINQLKAKFNQHQEWLRQELGETQFDETLVVLRQLLKLLSVQQPNQPPTCAAARWGNCR
ncbi:MAG: MarR family transcriptional regulator [Aestuariivita sp.]|nr:MarR family transcriptional regulator [Aestuariivita sp.]MCY4203411.1 MarR family transcriptional regulator [Aestuariivita sp.]MCY4288339.1 MarR family transcriptional regulator [Aestuariivita sp.]MCY4345665.1 MarR family transcriptional regulator [Aestuariivita sp.]